VTDRPSPDDLDDDGDLLARLDRDPVAFEAFYRRHVDRITGFAVRRCDGPEEVADLVAAVFLAVIESAHRYDPARGEPISWLFGVAANQLRMQRRGSWRQRGVAARVSGQRLLAADDVVRLEERIDAERLADEVRRAIARLPRGERAVFELVAREGLTPTQAAEALGVSPTAVRVRLSRARSKLRRDLGEALEPDPPEVPIERRSAVTTFRTSSASPASGATTNEEVSL
jgi:RNA polymerase sigma factor (sigma-70 family)